MVFTLEKQDPASYRRKARIISVIMTAQLLIFGVLFSIFLSSALVSSVWIYGLGLVLGLMATSALFAVLKERPWMEEVRYVWQLKGHLASIGRYQEALNIAIGEDNRAALDVLSFYYQGLDQLAELNGREQALGNSAEQVQRERVAERREALDMAPAVTTFDSQDLNAF